MKKKHIISAIAASVLALSSVSVSAKGEPGTGPNPFTDCGIGAALFPTVGWAAVSSNVIWDVGTTAVTSATGSPQTCAPRHRQAAQFILETYDNLMEEAARGEGEHLTAMLNILGCETTSHAEVIGAIRQEVSGSVASPTHMDQDLVSKASDYYDAAMSAASSHCAV